MDKTDKEKYERSFGVDGVEWTVRLTAHGEEAHYVQPPIEPSPIGLRFTCSTERRFLGGEVWLKDFLAMSEQDLADRLKRATPSH